MGGKISYSQWFKRNLPEDVAKRAIANTPKKLLHQRRGIGYRFLLSAFMWELSPEGANYWDQWYEKTRHL